MNVEFEPIPKRRFETINYNGKLVRDGIYELMKNEHDNPEVVRIEGGIHRRNVIRQKLAEEYTEFIKAEGRVEQTKEAGDFLAICELFAREIDVDQDDSELIGDFQRIMDERGISLNDAAISRQIKAEKRGEFSKFRVVRAVEVANPGRFDIYETNSQWQEVPLSDATSYLG